MLVDVILLYFPGLAAVASLLLAWFHTGFTLALADIARYFGWRKNDDWFWKKVTTREEFWDIMTMLHPNLLMELLTCPVCLSFHLSFWVGLITLALNYDILPIYYPLITAFTWPILANLILLPFNKHEL